MRCQQCGQAVRAAYVVELGMAVPRGRVVGRFVGINISICGGRRSVVMRLLDANLVLVRSQVAIRRCCHPQRLE